MLWLSTISESISCFNATLHRPLCIFKAIEYIFFIIGLVSIWKGISMHSSMCFLIPYEEVIRYQIVAYRWNPISSNLRSKCRGYSLGEGCCWVFPEELVRASVSCCNLVSHSGSFKQLSIVRGFKMVFFLHYWNLLATEMGFDSTLACIIWILYEWVMNIWRITYRCKPK